MLTVAVRIGVAMTPCPFRPMEQGLPDSDMMKKRRVDHMVARR